MISTTKKVELEKPLLVLAIALGAFLRFYQLGRLPLGDFEASLALNALNLTKDAFIPTISNTLYTNLTAALFFLFAPTNFFARFVPALAGALLVASPMLLKDKLGKTLTVVLTLVLALDPNLVTASRSVNLTLLPMTLLLWLFAAFYQGRFGWAGVFLALFLLSGPQAWFGIAAIVLTELVLFAFGKEGRLWSALRALDKGQWKSLVTPLLFTYILVGSFFLLNPTGLGSIFSSLQGMLSLGYSKALIGSSTIPPLRLLLSLGIYEVFGLFFAFLGIKNLLAVQRPAFNFFGWASLFALMLVFINPTRLPMDVVWAVPFVLLAAATFLSDLIENFGELSREVAGMFVFCAVLLVFISLNYVSLALVPADQSVTQMRWSVLIGSITLLIISFGLVGYGWSLRTASLGITTSLLIFFALLNLFQLVSVSHLRANPTEELTDIYPILSTDDVLNRQLKEVLMWNGGSGRVEQISAVNINSPALAWMLRNDSLREVVELTDVEELDPIIITQEGYSNPDLEANYRGQNIFWKYDVPFDMLTITDWMKWSVNRTFPKIENKLILWIRADQFIDRQNNQ